MDKVNFDTLETCDIEITNHQGKMIPIKDQVIALSIYESIFQPLITCELTVYDAIAMAQDLPIIGEETLTVRIKSTNAGDTATFNFTLHGLDNIINERRHQGYTLTGTSVEALADARTSIQRVYFDTYTAMVDDIARTSLRTQKQVMTTPSRGVHRIAIPNLNPLKAIDFLRQRAVSTRNGYSPFVFFETRSGFHFSDIVALFNDGKTADVKDITRYYRIVNADGIAEYDGEPWKNILTYRTLTQHDTLSKTHNGAFYNNLNRFDFYRKQFREVETRLSEIGNSFDLVDEGQFNTPNMVDDMSSSGATNYMVYVDSTRSDTHIDFLGAKVAFSTLLFQNVLESEFHGDTTLEAGKVLYLDMIKPTGLTDTPEEDPKQTGYHMISKLAHHITISGEPSLRTSCELVKGTVRSIEGSL